MSENTEDRAMLGRYEMVTQLGEGGMALVHLAIARGEIGFNKLVVVKQVRPELSNDPEFLQMFRNEAEIALLVRHPNVVETLEVYSEGGLHLIAMEFLEGHSLAELQLRLDRSRVPLEEHLWVLTQVLAGLHHAHSLTGAEGRSLEVVHRDVSPPNVFLTYDGEVKLLDFGIAKIAGAVSLTGRGTIKGKLGYCAPEQLLGAAVDGRADVYSVGVMMWEALAGRRRRVGDSRNALIEARLGGHEPRIRQIAPHVPAPLAEICDRATAVDPAERYPSARHMQVDLEQVLRAMPRQVGQLELALLMIEAFQSSREALRRRIERALGGSNLTPTRDLTPHIPGANAAPDSGPFSPTTTSPGFAPAAGFAVAPADLAPHSGAEARSTLDAVMAPDTEVPPRVLSERARLGIGAVLSFSMGMLLVLAVSPRRDRSDSPRKPAPARQLVEAGSGTGKPVIVNLERAAPQKKRSSAPRPAPPAEQAPKLDLPPPVVRALSPAPSPPAPARKPVVRRRASVRPAVELAPPRPIGIAAATRPTWTSSSAATPTLPPPPSPPPPTDPPPVTVPAAPAASVLPGADLKQTVRKKSSGRSAARIDEANPYEP